jgi:ComF family protein
MGRLGKGGFFIVKVLNEWWRVLEDLLFPLSPPCGLCGERTALPVGACKPCLESLAIQWQEREIEDYPYFSLFPYQGFGRDRIHHMKFQRGYDVAATLGLFLGLAAREEPQLAKVDVLIPVPLSEQRLEMRGFNQADILADNMREVWKKPVCRHVLRIRETMSQSELPLTKRVHNVRGAFAVLPGFEFRNKTCLIVDDVITSGSTFLSIARLIGDYGGRAMGVFAARTEILRSDQDAEEL